MFIITVDIHGDSTPFSVAGRIYHITRWTDFGPRLLHPPKGCRSRGTPLIVRLAAHVSNRCKSGVRLVAGRT